MDAIGGHGCFRETGRARERERWEKGFLKKDMAVRTFGVLGNAVFVTRKATYRKI